MASIGAWVDAYVRNIFYTVFAIALALKRPLTITLLLLVAAIVLGFVVPIDNLAFRLLTRPIILEFVAGMVIAKLYSDGWFRRGGSLLPIGVIALCLGIYTEGPRIVCFGVPACAILIGALALEGARVRPKLALLGDASYAIYLVHPLALFMLRRIFRHVPLHGWPQLIIFVLISLAASIVAGVLIHLFVERPIAIRLRLKASER